MFFWGATPVATKLVVAEMSPIAAGVVRNILAAMVTWPLVLIYRLRLPRSGRELGLLSLVALGPTITFPLLFTVGMSLTTASHAGLILAILPLPTGLMGAVIEKRMPPWTWWLGTAIALAGTAFLMGADRHAPGDAAGAFGGPSLAGDLLIAVATLSAAIGHVAGARLAPTLGSWPTTLLAVSAAGVLLLIAFPLVSEPPVLLQLGATTWLALLFLALGATLLAFATWYWALSKGGIARIGAMQFLQPVVTLALAWALLNEQLSAPLLGAAALILAGVALSQRNWRTRTAAPVSAAAGSRSRGAPRTGRLR